MAKTTEFRPQQACHGPGLGRSHTAESGPRGVVHATLSRAGVQPSETVVVERSRSSRRGWYVEAVKSSKACRGDFRGAGVFGAVGDLVCRCALLRSAIKKRFGCKCVRFGIPFSRDPRNPDVGKLLEQGARFRVQGSDVLLANLRAAV